MIYSIFTTVAIMLVYMMIGFCLCKSGKAVVSHAKSLSAILIYILGPCMIINSFLGLEYSGENIIQIGIYFIVSLLVQVIFFAALYVVFSRKYNDSKYRILTVGAVLGNVGFLGMPVAASVFPGVPIVLVYSSINVMSMNLIVFTIGTFMITNDKKYISVKNAILNPTTIAIIISLPLFIFGIHFPETIESGIGLLGKMVTPICMLILGMRLSEAKLKAIFTRPFVYATCLLKLVVFPIVAFLLVHWIPWINDACKTTVVVLAMTPAGAIIQSLSELYECEQEFAANVVLLTTIISVVTIPLMAYILV
ncbi:MAG: AEC family transporter [Lachnospiraceae bacterium]|nr:AEC family transporter [Lachnospiraceae bacterium]